MKKILTLLLGIILLTGCTKDDKAEVVPAPPENLTGEVISTTVINLIWTDRSTNETGFKIERKLVSGTFEVIGTTATDIATFSNTGLTPSTNYIYRVYSYNEGGKSPVYSNELSLTTTALLPTITTTAVTSITTSSATSGGTITSDGGAAVTARGICWSTSSNPTIALSTKTTDGTGTGSFSSSLIGLASGTTYYVRAYATNSAGTGYGTQESFATLLIPTITNGTQFWQNTNLNVATYSDGTLIPEVQDPTAWSTLTTGAWCYYNNDASTGATYGKLYNWHAVEGIWNEASKTDLSQRKKLAPEGYHIPSDTEWRILTTYLGGDVGNKMKATTCWINLISGLNTNSSGFTGLPGGCRSYNGSFLYIEYYGYWWVSSEGDTTNSWFRNLDYDGSGVYGGNGPKTTGSSVRCIRD